MAKKRQKIVNVVCERPLTHKLIDSQLQSSTFGKIPTLLNINLNHNRLKQVKRGAFGGLFSLRSINLENNQLVEIPKPSISLTHLHLGSDFVF